MRRSKNSKRLTWASDVNLCQVRLFLSEDSPSQVGTETRDLQPKALWSIESGGMISNENLPPGFDGTQSANLWNVKLSQIPLLTWKFPPRIKINSDWQVVAGEDSTETETQNNREMRVLEAVYPRPSAIPPNPSELVGADSSITNDENIPLVPVTPIEDEDASLDASFVSNTTIAAQSHGAPDFVASAHSTLNSAVSNNDLGSLIDHDLLIKILTNPKLAKVGPNLDGSSSAHTAPLHNMVSSFGMQNVRPSSTQNMPTSYMLHNMPSISNQHTPNLRPVTNNSFDPANMALNRPRPDHSFPTMTTSPAPFYPPSGIGFKHSLRPSMLDMIPAPAPAPAPSAGVSLHRDVNYYKSLIQQHGGAGGGEERREISPQFNHKSLIQQHGGAGGGEERREISPQFNHQSNQQFGTSQDSFNATNLRDSKPQFNHHQSKQQFGTSPESLNGTNSRDSKPKIMKPCIYFNSPKGCRNGANCAYQHETPPQQGVSGVPDVQNAKRVKLDREITCT